MATEKWKDLRMNEYCDCFWCHMYNKHYPLWEEMYSRMTEQDFMKLEEEYERGKDDQSRSRAV